MTDGPGAAAGAPRARHCTRATHSAAAHCRGRLAAGFCLLALVGCGGGSSVSVSGPGQPQGPVIGGVVSMPNGQVAAAPTALERLAQALVARVEALVAGNVQAVGGGVSVTLLEIGQQNVVDGQIQGGRVVFRAATNSEGVYSVIMPTDTDLNTCRFVLEVGSAAAHTLTRAFVYAQRVNIDFQSEAALRLILDQIKAHTTTLCGLDANDIASITDAVSASSNAVVGDSAAAVNSSAEVAAAADAGVQAAIAQAIGAPTPAPSVTNTAPPSATPASTSTATVALPTHTVTNTPVSSVTPSRTSTPTATNTTGPTATATTAAPSATKTAPATATNTAAATATKTAPATATTTAPATATNTAAATATKTAAATATKTAPATATNTAAATATKTAAATATNTAVSTGTNTPVSSGTPTPTNTATHSPTNTVPPTATSTAVASATSTASATASSTTTPASTATATTPATATSTPIPTNTATATGTGTVTNTATPTNTPASTATATNTSVNTATRTSTSTATPTNTAANTATSTPTKTPSPTPTNTAIVCPLTAGKYTQTTTGGVLKVATFASFTFPANGVTIQDVGAGDSNCVHQTVVPFPGGFTTPNFCVPALGATTSVTQSGCGVGEIDSNGGSDFTVTENGDTSEQTVCAVHQTACPGAGPAPDSSGRLDITVGNGSADTCPGGGTANAIVTIPVNTLTWVAADSSCPDTDGMYNPGTDTQLAAFPQTLDLTTDAATAQFTDLGATTPDPDGCKKSGLGPLSYTGLGPNGANGFCQGAGNPSACCTGVNTGTCTGPTGKCIDIPGMTVNVAAAGTIFSSGGPTYDLLFTTVQNSTVAGPAAPLGATCGSPPVINFNGSATRCLVGP